MFEMMARSGFETGTDWVYDLYFVHLNGEEDLVGLFCLRG